MQIDTAANSAGQMSLLSSKKEHVHSNITEPTNCEITVTYFCNSY